jgi:hypothetical protein
MTTKILDYSLRVRVPSKYIAAFASYMELYEGRTLFPITNPYPLCGPGSRTCRQTTTICAFGRRRGRKGRADRTKRQFNRHPLTAQVLLLLPPVAWARAFTTNLGRVDERITGRDRAPPILALWWSSRSCFEFRDAPCYC